jgi:hypothetical protein
MKSSILLLLLLLPVLIFGQVYSSPSQNKCSSENISVYGINIGMTQKQVENLFGVKLSLREDEEFPKEYSYAFIPKTAKDLPTNLGFLLISFYQEKVYQVSVNFENTSVSDRIDLKRLVLDLTTKWQIDISNWTWITSKLSGLNCERVEVRITSDGYIFMKDVTIAEEKASSKTSLLALAKLDPPLLTLTPSRIDRETNSLPEKCSVKFSELPPIRGLQLGMSKTNVLANYPKCRNEIGATCFYRAEDIPSYSFRNGLDAISTAFDLDTDKVSSFSLVYDTSLKWKSSKEFAESISDNLKFQINNWTVAPQKKPSPFGVMKYSCTNYYATVSFIDNYPNLSIVKSPELIKVEKSKKKDDFDKEQERKKKEFKP